MGRTSTRLTSPRAAWYARGMWGMTTRAMSLACAVVLAGCGGASAGPAWPRSAGATAEPLDDWHDDGGVDLAPVTPASAQLERARLGPEPTHADTPTEAPAVAAPEAGTPATAIPDGSVEVGEVTVDGGEIVIELP